MDAFGLNRSPVGVFELRGRLAQRYERNQPDARDHVASKLFFARDDAKA